MAAGERTSIAARATKPRTPASTAPRGTATKATPTARTTRQAGRTQAGQKRTSARATAVPAATRRTGATRRAADETATTQTARPRRQDFDNRLVEWDAMTLPVVHARVPVLRVNPAGAAPVVAQERWAAQALLANLPPPDRLLYYGGLGLAATVGVLEWPVAAAAGAGLWIATRTRGRERRPARPA